MKECEVKWSEDLRRRVGRETEGTRPYRMWSQDCL